MISSQRLFSTVCCQRAEVEVSCHCSISRCPNEQYAVILLETFSMGCKDLFPIDCNFVHLKSKLC